MREDRANSVAGSAPTVFAVVVILLVGSFAAYSFAWPSPSSSNSSNTSAVCSQPVGVVKAQLSSSPRFGEVTTFSLPRPLKAPNSITAAPDGSVWFGEVALRGVAHLFSNGTLLEYAWPTSFVTAQMNYCFDLSELWGIALWHGLVWASDSANDQLVGLSPSTDKFQTIPLADGSLPRYLTVDAGGNLWFTETSTPTMVGVLDSPQGPPRYFDVPAGAGQISASILAYNSSLAYVVTVNPSDNAGQVFSFDPSLLQPSFKVVGANGTLLAPYSAAVADGGLWVGQHDASSVAFYDRTSSAWHYYPTSINPEVPLTLPYYLVANGSSVWFNEHDSNKIAEISGTSSLTEFNISRMSLAKSGIGNALTIGLDRNLVWFTEWTGNTVGYVNSSLTPAFSILQPGNSSPLRITPGASTTLPLQVSGSSSLPLTLQFADSESHTSAPVDLSISSSVHSISALSGSVSVPLTVSAKTGTPPGEYLVLVTVTDGTTYRSVYITVGVT